MYDVQGLEQLSKKLLAFEPKLAKKGIRRAQRAAAKTFLPEVRSRAPVYEGPANPKTGRPVPGALRRSHRVRAMKRSRSRFGVKVTTAADAKEFSGEDDGFYGRWIELGSKSITPRGYIRAAFEAKEQAAAETLAKELASEIDAIARGS
jgi:HK97 gp10 family phage protein